MKKTELVKAVAKTMGVSQVEVNRKIGDINNIVEIVAKELKVGEKTKIGDYIIVEKKEVAARECRNPKTGESIKKDAHVTIKIKATPIAKAL